MNLFEYERKVLLIFKKLVYISCFFYFISQINLFNEFYLNDLLHASLGCKDDFLSYLSCFPTRHLAIVFFAMFFMLVILNIIKDSILTRFLFWIVISNVFSMNIYILDGGNNLITLISFFLIFTFSEEEIKFWPKASWALEDITGLFVNVIKFQIIILYFNAGVGKLSETIWQNGTALYYSLANPNYSLPIILDNLGKLPLPFIIIPSYLIIIFQIFLGPLLFNSGTKMLTLIMLFIFHLFIFIVMGLGYFAIFMWVSHTIFYEEEYFEKIKNIFNIVWEKVRKMKKEKTYA